MRRNWSMRGWAKCRTSTPCWRSCAASVAASWLLRGGGYRSSLLILSSG